MKVIRTDDEGFQIHQGSEQWKALRLGMLTGTGMVNILPGKRGGYTAARDKEMSEIVCEILLGEPVGGFKATKYMQDGIDREPYARMALEEALGLVIEEVAFVRHDWLRVGVSPDGLAIGEATNVEIKCPAETTHLEYWEMDVCPEEYIPQVQSQLWLTEAERCLFCSFHPKFPEDMQLRIIEVRRDEAFIRKIEDEVTTFLAEVNLKVKKINGLRESRKATV